MEKLLFLIGAVCFLNACGLKTDFNKPGTYSCRDLKNEFFDINKNGNLNSKGDGTGINTNGDVIGKGYGFQDAKISIGKDNITLDYDRWVLKGPMSHISKTYMIDSKSNTQIIASIEGKDDKRVDPMTKVKWTMRTTEILTLNAEAKTFRLERKSFQLEENTGVGSVRVMTGICP